MWKARVCGIANISKQAESCSNKSWNALYVRKPAGLRHFPSELRLMGKRRKLLWIVLFASLLGWFAKDGTNRVVTEFVLPNW